MGEAAGQGAAEQLAGELRWLDLVLLREIVQLRRDRPRPLDQFQGMYIADIDVDHLLAQSLAGLAGLPASGVPAADAEVEMLLQRLDEAAMDARSVLAGRSQAALTRLPLDRLGALFALTWPDRV